ncbi:hypothetical protein NDU88_005135 [Pleurodeles waltl]|uniref:Secreted protein n=1 Tax=Pleurodeles waltl TaxID=8319 RepID=A0AAV7WAY3_PLEWA|nr:hypothetical protein NDU88_005135 [Pleurodeles waltl]
MKRCCRRPLVMALVPCTPLPQLIASVDMTKQERQCPKIRQVDLLGILRETQLHEGGCIIDIGFGYLVLLSIDEESCGVSASRKPAATDL